MRAAPAAPPPRRASDEELVRAVERVWRPIFARAGQRYAPADVRHFGDAGVQPCHPPEENLLGLYCDDDRRIFLATDRREEDWRYVIAHEVGHHVQELRGTLDATEDAFDDRPSDGEDLHLREELQADCYAGVWGHAVGVPPPGPGFHELPLDEPGTPPQRERWLLKGHRTGRPGVCEPFSVREP